MSGSAATILAALIGAMIGSVGSILLDAWLRGNREKKRKRDELVQRYLLQLQDAVEGLWYRIDNLARRGGRTVMEDDKYLIRPGACDCLRAHLIAGWGLPSTETN